MFRDIFWNYPNLISKFIKITNPLFYILLAFFLGYFVFSGFTSDFVRRFVEGRDITQITEGAVGGLISTNPMYVTENSVDRDFYELVYEKFIEVDVSGEPVASLAFEWAKSSELDYLFKLREGVFWHDGESLTAEDIVWNFETAITLAEEFGEDTYGRALQGMKIEQIDDYTLRFKLEETNATFWEAISVYIIPKHIYADLPLSDFASSRTNSNPIGCGVYKVNVISQRGFVLSAFDDHWLEPSIKNYRYLFFEDYRSLNDAVKNNEIDIINTLDLNKIENLEEYPFFRTEELVLYNRQKLIFFNTRREKYSEQDFRKALSLLIDKERLLEEANIAGIPAMGPISPISWAFNDSIDYFDHDLDEAKEIFESLGYTRSFDEDYYTTEDDKILSVTLSFFENDFNKKLVFVLEEMFREGGVLLRLRPLNYDQVMREILPTRDFELLLYEIEVAVDPDQYNLWHSLRIDHPMLNISGYNYSRVDILLERARVSIDTEERKNDYFLFQRYLVDDSPVSFLYHPKAFFVLRNGLEGFDIENILSPSDRYRNVHEWHWNI
jgi:peptide/nickel transport system substrate-binding protein